MIVAFSAGACFGMIIASVFAAAGRCSYEEEVRAYYERRMQQDGHRDVAGGSRTDLRSWPEEEKQSREDTELEEKET